jgi:hypothetical protein
MRNSQHDRPVLTEPAPDRTDSETESTSPADRRRAFESLREAAHHPSVDIDARLLDVLARDIVEPRGEAFPGEAQALIAVLINEQDSAPFPGRVMAQAAIELGDELEFGTAAGRLTMMRVLAAFLLHARCAKLAAGMRSKVST